METEANLGVAQRALMAIFLTSCISDGDLGCKFGTLPDGTRGCVHGMAKIALITTYGSGETFRHNLERYRKSMEG